MTGYRNLGLLALVLVTLAACTTVRVVSPASAVGAQMSVERFLQAANQRDVRAMGRIFGTKDGPVMDTGGTFGCAFKKIGSWFGGSSCVRKEDVEIRMEAIASILEHTDYTIVNQQRVAGRTYPATRILVDLTTIQGVVVELLPFIVVQRDGGQWLVEQVDLQRVMAAR